MPDPSTWPPNLKEVDVSGDITLIVAHRGGKVLNGLTIEMEADAQNAVRQACKATLDVANGKTARPYEPSIQIDEKSETLLVPDALLIAKPLPQEEPSATTSAKKKRASSNGAPAAPDEPLVVAIETDPQVGLPEPRHE